MKKKIFFVSLLFLIFPFFSFAKNEKTAVYFYADWCPHCKNVDKYFMEHSFYEKYNIEKLNFDVAENKELLNKIFDQTKYSGSKGLPALVIDEKVITGDVDIIAKFENELNSSNGKTISFIESFGNVKIKKDNISIWLLLGAAFVDASNPCALAVLVLLLATVIAAKGKKYALLSGFMFSFAIFISYFLMGLGVYKAIGSFGISNYISIFIGILAIVLALANLKDFFWYGKFFIMEVPLSWRPKMQSIIKKATNPLSALGIGFLVSLFLVPCASGPYVVILGMLSQKVDMTKTILMLALYNFIFVLPMILITIAMYFFNAKMGKIEDWRKSHLRFLHLIAGIIMLVLGIYLVYTKV